MSKDVEELDEIVDNEEMIDVADAQVVKRISTPNNEVKTTFKGDSVVSYSIEPKGVAKALIDTNVGIITFEKYDDEWYGEVTLNLETESGDETYTSEYYVTFNEDGIEEEDVEENAMIDLENDDVEMLSDEEEDETEGSGTKKRNIYATLTISSNKLRSVTRTFSSLSKNDSIAFATWGTKSGISGANINRDVKYGLLNLYALRKNKNVVGTCTRTATLHWKSGLVMKIKATIKCKR